MGRAGGQGELAVSDILKDPTEHLRLLCDHREDADAARRWHRLHLHLAAGGALPAQWRAEGTEVGRLVGDAEHSRKALVYWRQQLLDAAEVFQDHINDLGRGILKLKGLT